MAWFEVKGGLAAGKKLMDTVEVWTLAENLGSVESLIHAPGDDDTRRRRGGRAAACRNY